jgi:hypothetical protein
MVPTREEEERVENAEHERDFLSRQFCVYFAFVIK